MALALWTLTAALIGGLYSGAILVKIVHQKQVVPFRNIAALARCVENKNCILFATTTGGSMYQRLVKGIGLAPDEMFLHNAVKKHPIQIDRNPVRALFGNANPGVFPVFLAGKITALAYQVSKDSSKTIIKNLSCFSAPMEDCFSNIWQWRSQCRGLCHSTRKKKW